MNRIFLARISVAEMVLWKRFNAETDPKVSLGLFPSFFKNDRKSLKNWKVLRDFRIFWIGFRYIYIWLVSCYFGSVSSFFGSISGFQKKRFKASVCWSFSSFLGTFPVFQKSLKFLVCSSVSSFLGRFNLFWVHFWFSKKV